ncbi:MAG TPA: nitrogenase iron-molybdenum cofactor biosynthesis protein NifN [Methylococcaceae bacterium]|nr:nitrogenase iron-molybdenum cofactor biosynthesis protein NifN [Methylococcaceae bacterium]
MAEILKRNKALSVSPLKASQPVGGSLATLGFQRAIPMLHGSQGCTAFAKVYFVRHFREPIPLQTTAMDQVSSVMGADDNVVEGLKTICEKSSPALVTVLTTGLSEVQGTDIQRCVKEFRAAYPQFQDIGVVAVNTPDFAGCLESGYAATLEAVLDSLVPDAGTAGTQPGTRPRQVNVLAGSFLTPGDLEALQELLEAFELKAQIVPDISDSLDGHLTDQEFSPVTVGGAPVSELATLGDACATLVIGASLHKCGKLLEQRTGMPSLFFEHLHGLEANDRLVATLAEIAARPVPHKIERQRAQLQDAMVDTHFMLGQLRVAVAADPDLLNSFAHLLREMGAEIIAAVAAANGPALSGIPVSQVKIGDLEDLEQLARQNHAELVIGNSHAVPTAERLGVPILRCGFPLYDLLGGYQKTWIGYRGARQFLFDMANLALSDHGRHAVPVYRSIYAQKPAGEHAPSTERAHA